MHRAGSPFYAPLLLLLLAVQGGESIPISFNEMTSFPNGSFQGLPFVNSVSYSGYICGTSSKPNTADAKVICHQSGYALGSLSYQAFSLIQGFPSIVMKDPDCVGTESDIGSCVGSEVRSHSSSGCSDKAYKITCSSPYYAVNATVRISSGGTSGPVQWSDDNVNWSTFCRHNWGEADAQVVCRQLGYENGDQGVYGLSDSRWAAAPGCEGGEVGVEACSGYSNTTSNSCNGNLPAGAKCSKPYEEYSYDIKSENLFMDNKWLPICAYDMSATEIGNAANNICKRNGYTGSREEKSVRVSAGFTAYVRAVICSERDKFSSCKFIQASSGQGFKCYDKLSFTCYEKIDLSWLWNLLRYGLPGVIMGIAFLVVFIMHRIKMSKRKKVAATRGHGNLTAGGPGAVGTGAPPPGSGYPAGYPLQHAGSKPPPPETQPPPPGFQQGGYAPPPTYNSVFPGAAPASTPTGYNQSGYSTAQDYGDVPAPVNYHLPPIQQHPR